MRRPLEEQIDADRAVSTPLGTEETHPDGDRGRLDFLSGLLDPESPGIGLLTRPECGLIVIVDGQGIPPGRLTLREAIDALIEQASGKEKEAR